MHLPLQLAMVTSSLPTIQHFAMKIGWPPNLTETITNHAVLNFRLSTTLPTHLSSLFPVMNLLLPFVKLTALAQVHLLLRLHFDSNAL